jgi:pilus assembly protein Flp/PilA
MDGGYLTVPRLLISRGIQMLNTIKTAFVNFISDEEGASAIEYALIAAMVAIALINFVTPISQAINGIFTQISSALGSI